MLNTEYQIYFQYQSASVPDYAAPDTENQCINAIKGKTESTQEIPSQPTPASIPVLPSEAPISTLNVGKDASESQIHIQDALMVSDRGETTQTASEGGETTQTASETEMLM